MKKILTLLLSSFFIFSLIQCNSGEQVSADGKWKLVWQDEFNGKEIDTTKWAIIPRGESDWNNYMSDYEGLFDVKDGNLILRGIANTVLENDTAPFLTGGVYTKDKRTFGNGRIEIRAKLQPATGAWPAIWMMPDTDIEWPDAGEIDIMERIGHNDAIYQTVHTTYTYTHGIKDNPPASSYIQLSPNKYVTYALETYPDSLVFYVNDTKTKNYPRIDTELDGQFPFNDNEFFLLIDMQLGGNWAGPVVVDDLPAEMHIDWVRFYEANEPEE